MPKIILFTLSITVIMLTVFFTLQFSANSPKSVPKSEIDIAINQAQYIYRQKKLSGEDFSSSPCLSNDLLPGWVVDIVHSPRLEMDNFVENQCPAYLEGRAKHIVELDLNGDLIGAR